MYKLPEDIRHEILTLNFIGSEFTLTSLDEGAINTNYKLECLDNIFLLKFFANNEVLPVDREDQLLLQAVLHRHHFAPKPLYIAKDKSFYIEQWIAKQAIPSTLLLERLANVQWKIHASELELNLPLMDLSSHWKQYLAYIPDSHVLKHDAEGMLSDWNLYTKQYSDICLCHHDLHINHLSGQDTLCYDWEYSARHYRYFDLACTSVSNQFTPALEQRFLQHYAENVQIDNNLVVEAVTKAKPFVDYTYQLWWYANTNADES
ncbi:phosphotransferase [Glaciecola sp. 1036]|uniref:phosphotransferase n=1 Tax=Alteromonadaceae TaxID=72275 RepID=UPI003CFF5C36